VFSSEFYGDKLATYFDAVSVLVNQSREIVPISGTKLRAQLISNWHYLPKAVQSGLSHRIVIVGGESAGKTTLAKAITAQLNQHKNQATYIAEYGREYNALKLQVMRARAQKRNLSIPSVFDCQWQSQEFIHIAQKQIEREQQASLSGYPYLICDTDAFATQFWHHRYMGYHSSELKAIVAQQPKRALYILPDINDVPFEQDGLRDGEHIRHQMHEAFRDALLSQTETHWIEVKGSVSQRVEQAIQAIHGLHHPFETSQYE
jgi:NadR type nicotinamide-nucleotide adenylyltransferase